MNLKNVITFDNKIIKGPFIIEPQIFSDNRGHFYESWNQNSFNKNLGRNINFVQDNQSKSKRGVLRGLHFQISPFEQEKLVSTIKGAIYDVIVDIRKDSPTYSMWAGIELTEQNKYQLWVPKGFAHGFLSLENDSVVQYKVTNFWSKDCERSLKWNDEIVSIKWPLKDLKMKTPLISDKDNHALKIQDAIY